MMTLFSTEVKHADIEFYENQKANAIAQIVTERDFERRPESGQRDLYQDHHDHRP